MTRSVAVELGWVETGTGLCERALAALDDAALAEPSALPGWSRAHLVAHVDGNARGLANLVTWARTGVETPMYESAEQRLADIEAGAALPADQLRARFAESSAELARALSALSEAQWSNEVRTIQGRVIPATEIPWLRSREVMVHACDLIGGVTFDDLPDDFLAALIAEITGKRSATADHPALILNAAERRWEVTGVGDPVVVTGSLSAVGEYLTGRSGLGPDLPAWL